MSVLKGLKLTTAPKRTNDPLEKRRQKMIQQLEQQRAIAENPNHTKTKYHWKIGDDGNREQISVSKPIKRWWFKDAKGDVLIVLRYGSRMLEIDKGKSAVIVGSLDNLIPVINQLIDAVAAGELDGAIDAVQSFGKSVKRQAA